MVYNSLHQEKYNKKKFWALYTIQQLYSGFIYNGKHQSCGFDELNSLFWGQVNSLTIITSITFVDTYLMSTLMYI